MYGSSVLNSSDVTHSSSASSHGQVLPNFLRMQNQGGIAMHARLHALVAVITTNDEARHILPASDPQM